MNQPFYGHYRARCTKIVDGDTLDLVVDLGFRLNSTMRVRLWGIDTAEMNDKDPALRKKAQEAKEFVILKVPTASAPDEWPLRIDTYKDPDHFGRGLAVVHYLDAEGKEISLNDELVAVGLAEIYRR
jgi:micrococcal nuclease